MGEGDGAGVIGTLGLAVGVAVSPLPVIGVLVALIGAGGRRNGAAFLLGWGAGVAGVVVGVYVAVRDADLDSANRIIGGVQLAFGLVLVAEGVRRTWNRERFAGAELRWLGRSDRMTRPEAVGAGLALAVLNPKNVGLCATAAVGVAHAELDGATPAGRLGLFVAVACSSVAAPVLFAIARPQSSARVLGACRTRFLRHGHLLVVVVVFVVGIAFTVQGLRAVS
jgi:hypothetical protein